MNQGSQFRNWEFTDAPLSGMPEPNLLSDGSDFSQDSWTRVNVTVSVLNSRVLPDGSIGTASLVEGNGVTPLEHYVYQDVTIPAGAKLRLQLYVRQLLESTRGRIAYGDHTFDVSAFRVRFQTDANAGLGGFTTETFVDAPQSYSARIAPVGDDNPQGQWYFVELDFILDAETTAARLRLQLIDSASQSTFTGFGDVLTEYHGANLSIIG